MVCVLSCLDALIIYTFLKAILDYPLLTIFAQSERETMNMRNTVKHERATIHCTQTLL